MRKARTFAVLIGLIRSKIEIGTIHQTHREDNVEES
jgi:hypothetical protein